MTFPSASLTTSKILIPHLEAKQDAEVPRWSVIERVNQIYTSVHRIFQDILSLWFHVDCQLRLFITVLQKDNEKTLNHGAAVAICSRQIKRA